MEPVFTNLDTANAAWAKLREFIQHRLDGVKGGNLPLFVRECDAADFRRKQTRNLEVLLCDMKHLEDEAQKKSVVT